MRIWHVNTRGAITVAAAAKFTGSGGAIVAFCPDGREQEEKLRAACEVEGFVVEEVRIGPQHLCAANCLE